MKRFNHLFFPTILFFGILSCGGEAEAPNIDLEDSTTTEPSSETSSQEKEQPEVQTENLANDYHITLQKDDGEITTGMSAGKAMIADDYICTVGDWKMKILTEGEYSAAKMEGNEYHAHLISKEFNSLDCQCQITEIEGTGTRNSIGERVKADGTITCDGGEVNGTFKVELIEPNL